MSVQAMAAVMALGPEVGGAKRLVLLSLANHASNDRMTCWPKRSTIAQEAGIKKLDTVTQCLSWLEERGYITRDVNGWGGYKGEIPADARPNLYRLTLDEAVDNGSPFGGEGSEGVGWAPRDTGRGAPRETGTRGSPPNGDQNHHLEPSLEPAPVISQRETKEGRHLAAVPETDEDSSNQEQTPEAIAATAFAQLGYPPTTTPTAGNLRAIQRALNRGWSAETLADYGTATHDANPANPRKYLTRCWETAGNTDPKLAHHKPKESIEDRLARIDAERAAKGLPVA